jgi:hypothetical protein
MKIIKTMELDRRSEAYRLIDLVQRAVSTDQTRHYLSRMRLVNKGGYLVATDGRALHKLDLDSQFIYSSKLFGQRPCPELTDRSWMAPDVCEAVLTKDGVLMIYEEESPFPNWQRLLPKDVTWINVHRPADADLKGDVFDLSPKNFGLQVGALVNLLPDPVNIDLLKRLSSGSGSTYKVGIPAEGKTTIWKAFGYYFEALIASMEKLRMVS